MLRQALRWSYLRGDTCFQQKWSEIWPKTRHWQHAANNDLHKKAVSISSGSRKWAKSISKASQTSECLMKTLPVSRCPMCHHKFHSVSILGRVNILSPGERWWFDDDRSIVPNPRDRVSTGHLFSARIERPKGIETFVATECDTTSLGSYTGEIVQNNCKISRKDK